MPHAIVLHEQGAPDVMKWEEIIRPEPGPGEARIKQTMVAVNYIDVMQRNGGAPLVLPASFGMEAVGIVDAIGDGVTEVTVGDRVAYVMGPPGAYTEERVYPAWRLVPVPDDITDEQSAGMMLKGLTVSYLVRRTYPVKKGDTVLVHAAAGGVGLIMCQWLKQIGANVIGTISTDAKAEVAKAHGCDHPIIYTRENVAERVMELTNGEGVSVAYDSVGADTYEGSLKSLARFGMLVSFGAASGPPPPVPASALAGGALFFTRPGLGPHTATRELLLDAANALFDAVRAGIKVEINHKYALKDAAKAHTALEGRQTTGSTVLTV
jgi:NADPH2:quinone reductase